jgi:predicted alpha/beta superfamily hydrolase
MITAFAGQLASAQERKPSRTGTFQMHARFASKFLAQERDILVYLPPGYETDTKRRYPVLYMHDGQNLFDGATSFIPGQEWRVDETAQRLISEQTITPLIIVGIYHTGVHRLKEYTPTPTQRFPEAGKADAYGRMLVEELKPFIDRAYRTRKGAQDTGLCGSSLGGLVSLYLGLKYPDVFGKLALVSPSLWWDNRLMLKQVQAIQRRPRLRIWLDMGTREGSPIDAAENIADARALRDALLQKGWQSEKDLTYLEAEGAQHNEAAWAARIEPILRFLFPPH